MSRTPTASRGSRWADDPAAHEAMKKKVPETVGACFDLIERKMFKGPWAMGDSYTVADPYLFTIARWMEVDSVDAAAYPRVLDHRDRMAGAPGCPAGAEGRGAGVGEEPVTGDRDFRQYSDMRRANWPDRQERGGNMDSFMQRRSVLGLGAAASAVLAAGAVLDPQKAAAQAASESVLRTALDRGKLIVGTGSTNPPWHFEDDKGNLIGMDIAMGRHPGQGSVRRRRPRSTSCARIPPRGCPTSRPARSTSSSSS